MPRSYYCHFPLRLLFLVLSNFINSSIIIPKLNSLFFRSSLVNSFTPTMPSENYIVSISDSFPNEQTPSDFNYSDRLFSVGVVAGE